MFFTRRRWALRITDRMGLPARSPEAAALVRVIILSAKQNDADIRTYGGQPGPKQFGLLRTATILDRRPEPAAWLSKELDIPASEASRMVRLAGQAARELLAESGHQASAAGGG